MMKSNFWWHHVQQLTPISVNDTHIDVQVTCLEVVLHFLKEISENWIWASFINVNILNLLGIPSYRSRIITWTVQSGTYYRPHKLYFDLDNFPSQGYDVPLWKKILGMKLTGTTIPSVTFLLHDCSFDCALVRNSLG